MIIFFFKCKALKTILFLSPRFKKGKNWRATYLMRENAQKLNRPEKNTFKAENRPLLIHKGILLNYKNGTKKSLRNHNRFIS